MGFIEGALPVRHWLTVPASSVFAAVMLLALSDRPAGSQPIEPIESSEAWCRTHNPDPSAALSCIEAEKRVLAGRTQTSNQKRPRAVSDPSTAPESPPLPRPQA